jgi:hypothetical protein
LNGSGISIAERVYIPKPSRSKQSPQVVMSRKNLSKGRSSFGGRFILAGFGDFELTNRTENASHSRLAGSSADFLKIRKFRAQNGQA